MKMQAKKVNLRDVEYSNINVSDESVEEINIASANHCTINIGPTISSNVTQEKTEPSDKQTTDSETNRDNKPPASEKSTSNATYKIDMNNPMNSDNNLGLEIYDTQEQLINRWGDMFEYQNSSSN